jgi:hypothetical protein
MISRRLLSYIILISFYLILFISLTFSTTWFISIKSFSFDISLFSFFVTAIIYLALDKVKKYNKQKRAFLSLIFRSSKLLLYLLFSIFIVLFAPEIYLKSIVIFYVFMYFATSFLEILHVIYFSND